ncbi:MAG TPA: PH domain-containing protein [Candidatus Saccharimonadales bacterium]|nr:PH domain-containing protein [Candidatus Saccharimonadales bacterium]
MAKAKQKPAAGRHKYFADQFDDEEVLFVFRKHPIVMRKALIWGMLAWLVGPVYTVILTEMHVSDGKAPSIGFFWVSVLLSMAFGCLILAPSYIGWYFSIFIVTDQRFIQITQKGLFHRAVADLTLPQIQSVNYEIAGLQETLLGFGTIKMQTYVGDLEIHDVHHPAKIQKRLLTILRDEGITTKPAGKMSQPAYVNDEETEEDEETETD